MTSLKLKLWPSWLTARPGPRASLDDYPIRFCEKLGGHVSNAVLAVCCQNARMDVLCDPERFPIPPQAQFLTARLELEFLGEMHWPGTIEVGTRVDRVGQSSVTMEQSLFQGHRHVAIARSTAVLVDTATRRPTSLPRETVQAIRGWTRDNDALRPRRHHHSGRAG
jgi:acyl-CoA thioester hydrolase